MKKKELLEEIANAEELLKDYKRFITLLSDGPKGDLAKLRRTIGQIKLLLELSNTKEIEHPKNKAIENALFHEGSCLVKIRPCGKEYGEKTYLGFLIGDIADSSSITMSGDKIQLNFAGHNPGIFVPELGKMVFGYESWWGEIESEKDFDGISDNDIQNVWYVKAFKKIQDKKVVK